jgi:hypothetical protein
VTFTLQSSRTFFRYREKVYWALATDDVRWVNPRNAPIGRSGLCPPSVIGEKGLIRQEYFQSFIKRIVKILWAIIAIPIKSGLQGLSAQVDWAEGFPL